MTVATLEKRKNRHRVSPAQKHYNILKMPRYFRSYHSNSKFIHIIRSAVIHEWVSGNWSPHISVSFMCTGSGFISKGKPSKISKALKKGEKLCPQCSAAALNSVVVNF